MTQQQAHFPVIIEQDEDGMYIVSCPAFRGCHSYGSTVAQAMERIEEAIALCLEDEGTKNLNNFIGFREVQLPIAV
jgi:predicted RNase H-like HicB family nuclease